MKFYDENEEEIPIEFIENEKKEEAIIDEDDDDVEILGKTTEENLDNTNANNFSTIGTTHTLHPQSLQIVDKIRNLRTSNKAGCRKTSKNVDFIDENLKQLNAFFN